MTEVIIATVIIALLAAGMLSAFVGAQYFFNRSRHRLQAFNFAREAQDKLRTNYNYNSNPAMTIGTDKPESNIGTIIKSDSELADLSSQLTYDVSEPASGGYKAVTVHVTWTETSF